MFQAHFSLFRFLGYYMKPACHLKMFAQSYRNRQISFTKCENLSIKADLSQETEIKISKIEIMKLD